MAVDKKLTANQIYKQFSDNPNINEEFRNEMLGHYAGLVQAMDNCNTDPEKHMITVNPWGDWFQETHNWFVTKYQKYHN